MLGTKNKAEFAWAMYDWANSAFSTTIQAALLPIFFKDVAAANLEPFVSTSYWGYTQSVAMIIAVVLAPVLGAIADHAALRKRLMIFFVTTGAFFTASLFTVDKGEFLLCSVLYVAANVTFASANVFYDSFLPAVTSRDRMDWLSSLGYAYGYVGGGLLFLINIVMVLKPGLFFLKSPVDGMKLSFVTVGLWWFGFTVPFMRHVKEEKVGYKIKISTSIKEGFRRIFGTFKEIRKHREAFLMLIAYWFYIDAVGTIIKMAVVYGKDVGVPNEHLMGALLLTQFVAFPFAILYGRIAWKLGTKKALYLSILVYLFIMIWGYFLKSAWEFWALALLVATSQGGVQALSRSLFGRMVPHGKRAEFFGFFSVFSKFATVAGPAIYGFAAQLTRNSRSGIIFLIIFLLIGLALLSRVRTEEASKT